MCRSIFLSCHLSANFGTKELAELVAAYEARVYTSAGAGDYFGRISSTILALEKEPVLNLEVVTRYLMPDDSSVAQPDLDETTDDPDRHFSDTEEVASIAVLETGEANSGGMLKSSSPSLPCATAAPVSSALAYEIS